MAKLPTPRCRRKFCSRILAKKVNFEQKIIFSNEKMFQLHLAPHRQDDHIWGPILFGWRRCLQDPRDKEGHVLGCPGWRISADPLLDGERESRRNSEAFDRLMEALQGSLRPSEAHWGPPRLIEALRGSLRPLRLIEALWGSLRPFEVHWGPPKLPEAFWGSLDPLGPLSKTLWSPPRPSKSGGNSVQCRLFKVNFFSENLAAKFAATSRSAWFHHDRKKSIKTVKIITRLTNVGAYKMAGSFQLNVLLRKSVRLPCATV